MKKILLTFENSRQREMYLKRQAQIDARKAAEELARGCHNHGT